MTQPDDKDTTGEQSRSGRQARLGVHEIVASVNHDTEHAVVTRVGDEELARARVELHVRGRARDVTQLEARVPAHLV